MLPNKPQITKYDETYIISQYQIAVVSSCTGKRPAHKWVRIPRVKGCKKIRASTENENNVITRISRNRFHEKRIAVNNVKSPIPTIRKRAVVSRRPPNS